LTVVAIIAAMILPKILLIAMVSTDLISLLIAWMFAAEATKSMWLFGSLSFLNFLGQAASDD
jgi:hypothetical protein